MVDSCDAVDRFGKRPPGITLRGQHRGAGRRQAVVAPAALAGFFDPAAEDPAALFEAIEERIERRDAELEHPFGACLDQLAEVVAVPGLILDEREDQQLRAALLELTIEHPGPY